MTEPTPVPDAPDLPVRADRPADDNASRSSSRGEPAVDEQPVTPDVSLDDTDRGWGEDLRESRGGRDDEWYRRERPPHWE